MLNWIGSPTVSWTAIRIASSPSIPTPRGNPPDCWSAGWAPARPTMKAKKDHFESHFDISQTADPRTPRHRGIMAAVVTEPVSPKGQFGLFYMDARRYPYLCGHATIGAVATLIEVGALEPIDGDTVITVDTPSGPTGCPHPHPQGPCGIRGH
jgi:proline racemase